MWNMLAEMTKDSHFLKHSVPNGNENVLIHQYISDME